jgi:hypothetical protein
MLKAALWPIVALVALFFFADPIKEQFLAGNIAKFKVGIIEINMRDSDIKPLTDRNVAVSLVGLQEDGVVILLFTGPNGYIQCYEPLNENDVAPFKDLEARGLVALDETINGNEHCLDVELTENGEKARIFITDLISAQLKTAKAT